MDHPMRQDPIAARASITGCFCVVIDTSAKVSNLAPTAQRDPSNKILTGQRELFPPLCLLPTIDLRGNQTVETLDDATKPETLFSLGRPLWYWCMTELDMSPTDLVKFAQEKLLGGRMVRHVQDLQTETMVAAILGFRIGLEVSPAQDLVASHLRKICAYISVYHLRRICAYISDDRQDVLTKVLPEPVLAEAAAQIMLEKQLLQRHVQLLVSMLQAGLVSKGERGELVTRLLLLLAMDRCLLRTSSVACRFSQPVYLEEFLKSLFGEQWKVLGIGLSHLRKAKVFFNAFYPIWKKNPKDLIGFIRHNGLATCKQGQPGFDLLMAYVQPDKQGRYRLLTRLSASWYNSAKVISFLSILKTLLGYLLSQRVWIVFPGLDQDEDLKAAVELLLQERTDPRIFFEDQSIERECLQNIFSLSYGSVPDPVPQKPSRKRTAGEDLRESV